MTALPVPAGSDVTSGGPPPVSPTLTIIRRSSGEMAHIYRACTMDCKDLTFGGKRSASHQALILGKPAAWLCPSCAKAWAATWTVASGRAPLRRNRRRARKAAA